MTQTDFEEIVTYLKHPMRQTWIEAELPNTSQIRFKSVYETLTNKSPLPTNTVQAPYYVWPEGANKWGVELRLYFISDKNLSDALQMLSVNNNRHGYEHYDKRINNNDFIYDLFSRGFTLGTQDLARIR